MEEDTNQDEMSRLLTDREKQLLKSRQFDVIVHEQTQIDKEIETQLAEEEEELKREEEAYLDAKREASRIAKLQRAKEKAAQKNATVNGSRSWLGDDDEWEVAGGEDDFELFLANVKARSVAARAQIHNPADGNSSSSSTVPTKERSLTEASSLSMEWDHEAVMGPLLCCDPRAEESLEELTSLHTTTAASSLLSAGDLEWDDLAFLSSQDRQRQQLMDDLAHDHSLR